MADNFDYFVQVNEITPPLPGGLKYEAKVPYIVKNPGVKPEHINPGLHIYWGKTPEEAELKADAEAKAWIAQQQASEPSEN
jgi:hypothetical protein